MTSDRIKAMMDRLMSKAEASEDIMEIVPAVSAVSQLMLLLSSVEETEQKKAQYELAKLSCRREIEKNAALIEKYRAEQKAEEARREARKKMLLHPFSYWKERSHEQ